MWENFTTSYVNAEYPLLQINCKLFYFRKGYLPKILLHLKNEPPISTDFENFTPPPPSSHHVAINNVQSLP